MLGTSTDYDAMSSIVGAAQVPMSRQIIGQGAGRVSKCDDHERSDVAHKKARFRCFVHEEWTDPRNCSLHRAVQQANISAEGKAVSK